MPFTKTTRTFEIDGYILLSFPEGGSFDKALEWGKENGYTPTTGDEVKALSEKHPDLNKNIGMDWMYTVATTTESFGGVRRACCVWWGGAGREARLRWVSYGGNARGWFVFKSSKPSASSALCPHCGKEIKMTK